MMLQVLLQQKPSALIKDTFAPVTKLPSVINRANTGQRWRNQRRIRRFERPVGTRERRSGSYLWTRWRREAQPAGHCSAGFRERSWTAPGGRGLSTERPAAWWINLQQRSVLKTKKSLQGHKGKREKMLTQLHAAKTNTSLFLFINLCDTSNKWLPRGPFLWDLARQQRGVEITPRSLKASQNWWRGAKLSEMCAHFHLLKLCLFSSLWQTDGGITLAPGRGALLLLLFRHPQHIPNPWHRTCALLCNYGFT